MLPSATIVDLPSARHGVDAMHVARAARLASMRDSQVESVADRTFSTRYVDAAVDELDRRDAIEADIPIGLWFHGSEACSIVDGF